MARRSELAKSQVRDQLHSEVKQLQEVKQSTGIDRHITEEGGNSPHRANAVDAAVVMSQALNTAQPDERNVIKGSLRVSLPSKMCTRSH